MTTDQYPQYVRRVLSQEGLARLRQDDGDVFSDVTSHDAIRSGPFEGLYGRLYNRVIQTPALRKAAFSLWGSAAPLYDLDRFVGDAIEAARATLGDALVLDLPSGGGTLLPFLARDGFTGTVVEVDLAAAMLRRAVVVNRSLASNFRTLFLRSDALALPLRSEIADVVVSINGLHVVRDHARFVAEAARVTRSGGGLWLITPVDGSSRRSRAILAAANALEITPQRPPTLDGLRRLLAGAGFRELRSYGGTSITGLACQKP